MQPFSTSEFVTVGKINFMFSFVFFFFLGWMFLISLFSIVCRDPNLDKQVVLVGWLGLRWDQTP